MVRDIKPAKERGKKGSSTLGGLHSGAEENVAIISIAMELRSLRARSLQDKSGKEAELLQGQGRAAGQGG